MTGVADDQLETRLAAAFHRGDLPVASLSMETALERVPDAPLGVRERGGPRRSAWTVLGIAAVLGAAGLIALVGGGRNPSLPVPSDRPSVAAATRLTWEIRWTAAVPASESALSTIIAVAQKRVDASTAAGAHPVAQGTDRVMLDVPSGIDLDPIRRLIGQRGVVEVVPLGSEPVETGARVDPVRFPALFGGTAIVSAAMTTNDAGQPALHLTLGPAATRQFADYTAAHISDSFAITIDGTAISVPMIQTAIPTGDVEITVGPPGNVQSLRDVVTVIGSGPLPVSLVEVSTGPVVPTASSTPTSPVPSSQAAAPSGPAAPSGVAATSPAARSLPPDVTVECHPVVQVDGPVVTCEAAVQSALSLLPDGAEPVGRIQFWNSCVDVTGSGAALDCLPQAFGLVNIDLRTGERLVVQITLGRLPQIVAPLGGDADARLRLAPARPDESCVNATGAYVPIVLRIDPDTTEPVTAETLEGRRLAVRGRGIVALAKPFAMLIVDGASRAAPRTTVGHDGTRLLLGLRDDLGVSVCQAEDGAVLILASTAAS